MPSESRVRSGSRGALVAAVPLVLGLMAGGLEDDSLPLQPFSDAATAEDSLYVRVVDVGAGHCSVTRIPGDEDNHHYLVYDAGNYEDNGRTCLRGVEEVIPEGEEIDLLVLSHSDSDHLAAADRILGAYKTQRILWTGHQRQDTGTFRRVNGAMDLSRAQRGTTIIDLSLFEYPHGATYRLGEAFVTFIAGWSEPLPDWRLPLSSSEGRNSISVVVRVLFREKSVLFTGDTVGRHGGDPDEVCDAAEAFMVANSPGIPIDSDVLIAPHHGADNGSSACFIEAVNPEYVIFPAGHKYAHPRDVTARRYIARGVPVGNMYRTDRGDDEGSEEWPEGRRPGHKDPKGDDDVEIVVDRAAQLRVAYRSAA